MDFPISNNEIKFVRSLEQKKFRDAHGMFTVEGEKMVREALESGFEVVNCYREEEIGRAAMERLSMQSSPSPALAVVRKPSGLDLEDLSSLQIPPGGLFLALDGIRDPGNLGTILRTAEWFGVEAVFASRDTVELFNPKVVQATMGSIFRIRFHYCDIPSLCRKFTLSGGKVYGTFLDGESLFLAETPAGGSVMVVIGNESKGISPEVGNEVGGRLTIPSFHGKGRGPESLNAATATAITLAEFRRRDITGQVK